jgi:cation diffusion facilitator CzcD-associated flavoprotein CzcO
MYRSAHFISSKTLSGFPDFPMPDDYPDYPRHDQIQAYIESYAAHHDLLGRIDFGCSVTAVRPAGGDRWSVRWQSPQGEQSADFSGVVVATGVTWHPNLPDIPGDFNGEVRHSFTYRSPEEFAGKRVLVVGGGNSGVDIACDAARSAEAAFISLRRGYHFVPKYVFGQPSDVFAHAGPALPAWLEQRVFGFLINRMLVGDLTRYGLPKPDHPILTSHPIMNTQLLHYLGHGDIAARADVERFDGDEVVFRDGSRERIDLVLLATGYRRDFPFLDLRMPGEKRPARPEEVTPDELFLTLIHREHPTLSFMGIFETDGAAYDLFHEQAQVVAGTLWALRSDNPAGEECQIAARVRRMVASGDPDLTGGRRYLETPRHLFYVTHGRYRKALQSFQRELAPR